MVCEGLWPVESKMADGGEEEAAWDQDQHKVDDDDGLDDLGPADLGLEPFEHVDSSPSTSFSGASGGESCPDSPAASTSHPGSVQL